MLLRFSYMLFERRKASFPVAIGWPVRSAAPGRVMMLALMLAAVLATVLALPAQEPEATVKFTSTTNLVVFNVEVRDGKGNPVEGLTAADFELAEDGKRQNISIFEFQRLDLTPRAEAARPKTAAAPEETPDETPRETAAGGRAEGETLRRRDISRSAPGKVRYRDRRLLVLYFDFSSMPPADQIRAQKSSLRFLDEHMAPADLVAVMSFSTRLRVLQDFTDDRELLREVIGAFRMGEASELAGEADTDEESAVDDGSAFVSDETEFNVFNTDQKLSALESAANMLASLPEKKALVYFASGVGKTGVENHSQLRSTINAALRANMAFYPVDARGLVAEAPAGDARQGSARGSRTFSGQAQRQRRDRFNDQQETLFTLASDTGGKALLDSNDLTLGITQAQKDISSYYILGYYSTNDKTDGRFRRVKLRIPGRRGLKIDYRSGYFGPKEFRNFSSADKERQLEEALLLGDPVTDLSLALEVNYFRLGRDRYFIPLAVKIPGSEFELARKGGREKTTLDFIAQVRDGKRKLIASLRDHIEVKLQGENAGRLARRQLQYDSGFTLPPGDYQLKFLTRENQSGKMGTFETKFSVPDLDDEESYAKMSSVVWSNQRESLSSAVGVAERNKKLLAAHPLIHDGQKLIPSITRVFRKDQSLYVYFEVYARNGGREREGPSVAASLSFFRGGVKVFESEPVRLREADEKRKQAIPVEFQIPLDSLAPGAYTCQLNVVEETGRKFAFRRAAIILLDARPERREVVSER